jgi:hypothetical protein
MFEGIVFGFIVLVVCYVGFMRLMARRADVLHGEFIQRDGATTVPEPSVLTAIMRYLESSRLLGKR